MVYTKQNWADGAAGGTPISAPRLNYMETGIEDASNRATALEASDVAHLTAADPHPVYYNQARGDARYARTVLLSPVATSGLYSDLTGTVPAEDLPPLAMAKKADVTADAVPVATRASVNSNTQTGVANLPQYLVRYARTQHTVVAGTPEIFLRYGNWWTQTIAPRENDGPNALTVRASVEYPAGRWRVVAGSTAWASGTTYAVGEQVTAGGQAYVATSTPTAGVSPVGNAQWTVVARYNVTFGGASSAVLAPGADTVSDPVAPAVQFAPGAVFYVNTLTDTGSATNRSPKTEAAATAYGDYAFTLGAVPTPGSPQDPVQSYIDGSVAHSDNLSVFFPIEIVANTIDPLVHLSGDSISLGYGDLPYLSAQGGYMARALQGKIPHFASGNFGDTAQNWASAPGEYAKRAKLLSRATSVIVGMGTNDLSNGRTDVELGGDLVRMWRFIAAQGPNVYATTITPRTTSTDSWATVVNQTAASGFGLSSNWSRTNDWLRDGAPMNRATLAPAAVGATGEAIARAGEQGHPVTKVVDVARTVTDATTGMWAPSLTSDGIHPNLFGHGTMATELAKYVYWVVDPEPSIQTALDGKVDKVTPATVADTATIASDVSGGKRHFRVTLGGNRTLGNPTGMVDGQMVVWELIQDATGGSTLTLGSAFALGTDVAAVTLSTAPNKRDFLGAVWNAVAAKWYVLAFTRGY